MSTISPVLRDIVIRAVAGVAELDAAGIADDLNLIELGLDSLDFSTILVEIEDAAGEEIPSEILDRLADGGEIVVVGDVLTLLEGWVPPVAERS